MREVINLINADDKIFRQSNGISIRTNIKHVNIDLNEVLNCFSLMIDQKQTFIWSERLKSLLTYLFLLLPIKFWNY